jgi:hypothetical protein
MIAYAERFYRTPVFKKRVRLLLISSIYQDQKCRNRGLHEYFLTFLLGSERNFYHETQAPGNLFQEPIEQWSDLVFNLNAIMEDLSFFREKRDHRENGTNCDFLEICELLMAIDRLLLQLHHARFIMELDLPFRGAARLNDEKLYIQDLLVHSSRQVTSMVHGKDGAVFHQAVRRLTEHWLFDWIRF